MTHNTPLSPRPLHQLTEGRHRLMTTAQLRAHGVPAAEPPCARSWAVVISRCRPSVSWCRGRGGSGVVVVMPGNLPRPIRRSTAVTRPST
ncbi:hypothetical protein N6Q81_12370, partial [Streptomyces vinaceusdrappus]